MTQASFPFENIDTTETQFSKWARHFNNGVNDDPNGDALEVSVGTGLAVDVEPGEAMVRGHYYTSDATESLSLTTADATNDRIDTVVLRLDPVANTIVLAVRAGTPDAAPVAPTLVQTDAGVFEQALANVLVPANSGVPTTITDRREFMGTRLGSWSTAGRPDPAGRVLFGFNTSLGVVEFYNVAESEWQTVGGFANSDTPAYRFVDTVTFASSGTFTKASYPWLRAIKVKAQASGGAGAGTNTTGATETAAGSGGGAGGYAERFYTDIAGLDASVTVTVGAGAVGSTAGSVNGSLSEFGGSGDAWRTRATGGDGGGSLVAGTAARTLSGGDGGTGTDGDLLIDSGGGGAALRSGNVGPFSIGGTGGSSYFGGGGRGTGSAGVSGGIPGAAAGAYGAGGGGAMAHNNNSSARNGGDGGDGIVIVELYA